MDFKDYINGLSDLDNQEAKAKLTTFYTINSATFKFFKAIDSIVQDLIKQTNVNETALPQLEIILPILVKLRSEILEIGSQSFAKGYKEKISKSIHYIQDIMTINEVQVRAQSFFKLLEDNKKAFQIEQKNIEEKKKLESIKKAYYKFLNTTVIEHIEKQNKITTIDEAEKFFWEIEREERDAISALSRCEFKTIRLLAEESVNSSILQAITDYILDPEELPTSEEMYLWEDSKFQPYVIMNCLYNNPILNRYLRQRLDNESSWIKECASHTPFTDIEVLSAKLEEEIEDKKFDEKCKLLEQKRQEQEEILKSLNDSLNNTKSGCFIATACYGDYNAPEVLILRRYRDEYLLTNWLGTLFVKFYYAVSPSLAKHIEKSNLIKRIIRNKFLRPIVENIKQKYHN